jgi:polysaccharide export outer membrane protein
MHVVGETSSGPAALEEARQTIPDIIILALSPQATNGLQTLEQLRLEAEDLLEITIFNIPEGHNMPQGGTGPIPRKIEVRVGQAGMITLPLLGDVSTIGLTATDIERSLHQRYDEFLNNPQVGVYIKEYRGQHISVIGAVAKPGMYQLTAPRTLVDVLSTAGGIHERAGSQSHVYRQGSQGRQTFVIDLLALANNPAQVNMPVQAEDMISMPLAGTFFRWRLAQARRVPSQPNLYTHPGPGRCRRG